jgi:uncharacterized protein
MPPGPTPRTTVKRRAERGRYDRATVDAILDEAYISHVGFVHDGGPVVLPTMHARVGDTLYIHGSVASRMLRTLAGGVEACVTVTLLDGLVLARSAFHHSMNYRSVVVFGRAAVVEDRSEKLAAMRALVERVRSGRWDEARQPTETELRQTTVMAIPLDEVSCKVRTGPPIDEEEDYGLPVWAGVIPLMVVEGEAVEDETGAA